MGAFIRLYLQRAGRRLAPIYLAGESYGGFRAALLSRRLQADSGISVSGTILVSPALEMSLLRGDDFEPLRWALGLPSMAAVNLAPAGGDGPGVPSRKGSPMPSGSRMATYLQALAGGLVSGAEASSQGRGPPRPGCPLPLVERRYARIPTGLFIKEFARGEGASSAAMTASISAPDPKPGSESASGPDPVLAPVGAALTSAFVQYVREELGYRTDVTYRVLNEEVNRKWDYGTSPTRQGFAGALEDLQEARSVNPTDARPRRARLHGSRHALSRVALPDQPAAAARAEPSLSGSRPTRAGT